MKKVIYSLTCFCLAFLASCSGKKANMTEGDIVAPVEERYVDTLAANHPEYLPELPLDTIAPEISAPDTLGQVISLSSYKGKYVVIDFYASWCGDCRREAPELKLVYDEYLGKQIKGHGIQFMGYSFDRDNEAWRKYMRQESFPWPQCSTLEPKWHDNPAAQAYRLHWIPAFLLVNPESKICGKAITAAGLRQVIKDEIAK